MLDVTLHRISLRNKAKNEVWTRGLGKRGLEKHSEKQGLPINRIAHKIGGLETCLFLMNYLTQTNSMMMAIVLKNYDHGDKTI